jgi:sugar phosphate isomerase/epimerase
MVSIVSRRGFLKRTASSAAGFAVASTLRPALAANGKPNSVFAGVQIGTITYSYRSMPDQSAEAILGYIAESGISAVELMGDPAEEFAGKPANPHPEYGSLAYRHSLGALTSQEEEELEALRPAQAAYLQELARWRASAPMTRFSRLRSMFEDAGVRIYAWKPSVFEATNTDAEVEYGFRVAKELGASHCTTELPDDPDQSLRLGRLAAKHGVYIAYHTHTQASMTVFDEAFSQSDYNRSNVDLGHYVAAPNGGDPVAFLRAHHDRIASVHLKDRQTPAHGAGNLEWGKGDTPLVEILQLMRDERYGFPASIEVEYRVPEGSDAVREVRKCVEFCRTALEG